MSNITDFKVASEEVKRLKTEPTNEEKLQLYGLFKQATVGDVNTDRPGMLDFKGKAKWDSWSEKKGMATEDAEKQYVAVANKLIDTYGLQQE